MRRADADGFYRCAALAHANSNGRHRRRVHASRQSHTFHRADSCNARRNADESAAYRATDACSHRNARASAFYAIDEWRLLRKSRLAPRFGERRFY